jgi:uncharacterized protein YjbJ (UPF0337 family)
MSETATVLSIGELLEVDMDKDRVEGSAKKVKGDIKEGIGKATGDAKLRSEGKADKAEGKIQNAVGGVKDAFRDKDKDRD